LSGAGVAEVSNSKDARKIRKNRAMELTVVNLNIPLEYRYAYLLTFLAMMLCAICAKTPELANDFFIGTGFLIALTVPVILYHVASANGLLDLQSAQQGVPEFVKTIIATVFQCGPIFGSVGLVTWRTLKRRDDSVAKESSNQDVKDHPTLKKGAL
jgi:hypothetical protein